MSPTMAQPTSPVSRLPRHQGCVAPGSTASCYPPFYGLLGATWIKLWFALLQGVCWDGRPANEGDWAEDC